VLGYLRDLEAHVGESGVSIDLPQSLAVYNLREALRDTRFHLADAIDVDPDTLDPVQPEHTAAEPPSPTQLEVPAAPRPRASQGTVTNTPEQGPAPEILNPPRDSATEAPAAPPDRAEAVAGPVDRDAAAMQSLFAREWTTLVEQAAKLGFAVQTRYEGESEIDTASLTIHIKFEAAASRVVDLAVMLVQAATWRTPVQTVPVEPARAPRAPEPEFPVHTGTLDLASADISAQAVVATSRASTVLEVPGRFTGQLDLPAAAGTAPSLTLPRLALPQTSLYEQLLHELEGRDQPAPPAQPSAPPRLDRRQMPGTVPGTRHTDHTAGTRPRPTR
jgi:hypothetical protein